jgi:Xaa-Pro aminopeptidase
MKKESLPGHILKNKIKAMRKLMEEHGIQAYLVPGSDPHQNEYVPDFWQRRRFITGFTGSAGEAVISRTKACLWTDSRYFLQAEEQLDADILTLFKMGMPDVPTPEAWVSKELDKRDALGVDPRVVSHKRYTDFKKSLDMKGIELKSIEKNLVDAIWEGRPEQPKGKIEIHEEKYSGAPAESKLQKLREKMEENAVDAHVITKLDSIAWLLNIRGSDVKFNPLTISYAIVTSEKAMFFVDLNKVTDKVRGVWKNTVEIFSYEAFGSKLQSLARKNCHVWLDETSVNQWIVDILEDGAELRLMPSPIHLFKAVKNETEISGFKASHLRDGVAMVKFLHWLDQSVGKIEISEISAAEKLAEFRAGNDLFKGLSFETISAYGAHGAIVHYAASPETDALLKKEGIYLVDSGAHYLDGTTDITRAIALGTPTEEQRDRFTRVLKGLIDLSTTSFPQGTTGMQLDTISRLALWEKGLNFGHGTGHGIGTYLNVHEGPHAISYYRCIGISLEPGMITTIEPGFYKEKDFGMRIENVALVLKDEEKSSEELSFYKFETLTLCPIDLRLVKKELLSAAEMEWLNSYHRKVYAALTPLLDSSEAEWLKKVAIEI